MTDAACSRRGWRLSALLDDELTERERVAVSRHLLDCADCRAELDGLRHTRALLRGAPVAALPPHVAARMVAAACEPHDATRETPSPSPARRQGRRTRAVTRAAAAAVALTGLLGGTAFALGGDGPTGPARAVAVPLDIYVADHIVRTTGRPVSTPVVLEVAP